jgi:hypothetical protein
MSDKPKTRKIEARVSFAEYRLLRRWAGKDRGALSRLVRELIAERAQREGSIVQVAA